MKKTFFTIIIILSLIAFACKQPYETPVKRVNPAGISQVSHVEWAKDAVIYEVNIRQFSPEGTFEAVKKDLPRLKELGVDIVWLMPVFPIGEMNRKADQTILIEEIEIPAERKKYLGSYYATKDYLSVNPEYGNPEDFKSLVDKIHELGMYVILDIAINHTAWDHPWIKEHPDYYTRVHEDSVPWNPEWMTEHPEYFRKLKKLRMTYPINPVEFDWWDVAELDFDNTELRNEFVKIFIWWISEYDIDGYRCDHAHGVPTDFWEELRPELDKVKPVFMLAEAELPELHKKAFDMSYDWKMHHILNAIAQNKKPAWAIAEHLQWADTSYPDNSWLMQFTSNHDENSWAGTEFERMGQGARTFAVLAATLPDMLLIYNGQESAFNERLKFFVKDTIGWGDYRYSSFYRTLNELKERNKALLNGTENGILKVLSSQADSNVFAFSRQAEDDQVLVICNLGEYPVDYRLRNNTRIGNMKEVFTGTSRTFKRKTKISLEPWQYCVYENK
ncbi:MAG: alpha-glucosidase C-terminal domain-containing protein [Bacteroidales bacterium]|nr:alpha-glucosidase C-terminal domain-containing protein [Bacteroidales bacterium]MBN2763215.1 alpha-glucosidase C-terminal domain-containing protein [Bacteroidales bacterium]